jgi:L-histidine N-alpha-methyltransferase
MAPSPRPPIDVRLTPDDVARHFADDVRSGLSHPPRWIPAKWLYDPLGCELFERITTLDEYYPTRAEQAILDAQANDIAKLSGASTLVELGSGTSTKTQRLLDAFVATGTLERFVGFDVAEPTLADALTELGVLFPGVAFSGVVGDFERHLDALPAVGERLVVFLGGTIGNLDPERRTAMLESLAGVLRPGEHLLVGTDLVKDPARLVAAYHDREGVTERFERNSLQVVNDAFGADFAPERFDYVARWAEERSRIEMGVRARVAHRVRVDRLDLTFDLAEGEEIQTEVSTKFRLDEAGAVLAAAGLAPVDAWTDPYGDYALTLARRV